MPKDDTPDPKTEALLAKSALQEAGDQMDEETRLALRVKQLAAEARLREEEGHAGAVEKGKPKGPAERG